MTWTAGEAIDQARAEGRAALIVYLPFGYPTVETSIEAARTAVTAGADIVELGLPYSDPGMDGPVIQHATETALARGVRVRDIFAGVTAVRQAGAAALVMTYFNPIMAYGVERFAADLANAGGAGLITPDLIPDEAEEWIAAADRHNLDKVFLVAQSSPPERLGLVAAASRGFVYAASRMGVTGVQEALSSGVAGLVERTRTAGAHRVCVGIGVSNAEQATTVAEFADGVIVGSALVRALGDDADYQALADLTAELAAGVRINRA